MLELANVSRSFSDNKVLTDVSLRFEKSCLYALIGPNGSGKTTLINIIANVLLPDNGTVLIDGESPNHKNNANRKVYVVLAGDRNLHWRLTARDNIVYFLALKGYSKKQVKQKLGEYLEIYDPTVRDLLDKNVEKLSFGQKKKIMILIGFLSEASYLIFDEITEGLDIDSRDELKNFLQSFTSGGRTVIFSTHDLDFASSIADKAIVIHRNYINGPIDCTGGTDLLASYYTASKEEGT